MRNKLQIPPFFNDVFDYGYKYFLTSALTGIIIFLIIVLIISPSKKIETESSNHSVKLQELSSNLGLFNKSSETTSTNEPKITSNETQLSIQPISPSPSTLVLILSPQPTEIIEQLPTPSSQVTETTVIPEPELQKKEYSFNEIGGWIASFDYEEGKNSFYNDINTFTSVGPVYYDLNEDGTMSSRAQAGDKDLVQRAHQAGVKVIPITISFSAEAMKAMLTDEIKYKAHLDFLISEVEIHNYDGIDIDYESIYLENKDQYLQMLKDLSNRLKPIGKTLVVDVIAKDSDGPFEVLPQTRASQDWGEIAKYADQVRIMAYDYTSLIQKNNNLPGPVSPLAWNESVLKYAVSKMPPEKIILGNPLYAYAYDNSTRYGLTYTDCDYLINEYGIVPQWDNNSMEKTFTYQSTTGERKVWYHDYETLAMRFELAEKYNIGGIVFWRLGGEDDKVYNLLNRK